MWLGYRINVRLKLMYSYLTSDAKVRFFVKFSIFSRVERHGNQAQVQDYQNWIMHNSNSSIKFWREQKYVCIPKTLYKFTDAFY